MRLLTNKNKPFLALLLISFLIKVVLSFLPSFSIDMNAWISWAYRLAELGPAGFYSDEVWTQYTPGFLYYLLLIGKLGWVSEFAIKLPTIIADLGTATLLWLMIKVKYPRLALIAAGLYLFNPALIFAGSVWGQIDGVLTFFMFLSFYLLIGHKQVVASWASWAVALLIKPQAIALLPVLLMVSFKKYPYKNVFQAIGISLFLIIAGSFLFFPGNPILGFWMMVLKMGEYYNFTSLFAFNVWTFLSGMWKADSQTFLGFQFVYWGGLLYLITVITALLKYRKSKSPAAFYLLGALATLAFFLFPTRVHERYLYPFFVFLLAAAGLKNSKTLISVYIVSSLAFLVNLYHPYAYYTENFLRVDSLVRMTGFLAVPIGVLFLLIFLFLLFIGEHKNLNKNFPNLSVSKFISKKKSSVSFPKRKIKRNYIKYFLAIIIGFAFISRVLFLSSPNHEYFDEVYHAFTAKVVLAGDPKAWEWWNPHPEGFAYEWTHPPLAKLGMAFGMLIFGENSFGWRIPGALLGTGAVYLVYLIGRSLFKDELVGLTSAAVFSLEGLPLVMSRIGMNDIYLLFFILLTIYAFLQKKDFLAALSFGLALSSKWSAIWAAPILFVIWLKRKEKFSLSILWFLILPFVVYLLAYLPMFLTGHGFDIFIGVQKQMWWYHTGLDATHPYTSVWWSWPLLLRPIYIYTSEIVGGSVSRIYAMGNPAIFWFGLIALILSAVYALKEKNKNLGFLIFSYLIFFIPWAFSPRIMFLYHYLPSLPFLAIMLGFVLRRNMRLMVPFLALALVVFIYFYPRLAGLPVPLWLDGSYIWFNSWR